MKQLSLPELVLLDFMRRKSSLFPHFNIIPHKDMVQLPSQEDPHSHISTQKSSSDCPDEASEEKIQGFLQQAVQCEQDGNWNDTITNINAAITLMSPADKRKIEWECHRFALYMKRCKYMGA